MARLFDRFYRAQVDTILIEDLDIDFKVTKTLKKEPNTLELKIYNLNPDHRQSLDQAKEPVIQLEAGYQDRHGVIFLGDVREVSSEYESPNWVTTLSSGDGEKATRFDRINKSFAAGVTLNSVVKEVASAMGGIGLGNLLQGLVSGKLPGGGLVFANGVTVSGNASRELGRLVRSAGLEWSIQDQKFQVLQAGKTLTTTAVVLTPYTGLVGSPTIGSDKVLKFTSLLNNEILPGKQLVVKSEQVTGRFRVEKVNFEGSSSGQPWYVSGEAKELDLP